MKNKRHIGQLRNVHTHFLRGPDDGGPLDNPNEPDIVGRFHETVKAWTGKDHMRSAMNNAIIDKGNNGANQVLSNTSISTKQGFVTIPRELNPKIMSYVTGPHSMSKHNKSVRTGYRNLVQNQDMLREKQSKEFSR